MKYEIYTNHNICLVGQANKSGWFQSIPVLEVPCTLTFFMSGNFNMEPDIRKVAWNFQTDKPVRVFYGTKERLTPSTLYTHRYKNIGDTTLSVQASVYTDNKIIVTQPYIAKSISNQLHKTKNYYIEPAVFQKQILLYYKTRAFSDEVAESISKIANRLAFAPNFINYSYREEMVGDAIIKMVEALTAKKFNPKKGNPFSYFTKIAFHAFCNRIKREKRAHEALLSFQSETYTRLEDDGIIPRQGHVGIDHQSDSVE